MQLSTNLLRRLSFLGISAFACSLLLARQLTPVLTADIGQKAKDTTIVPSATANLAKDKTPLKVSGVIKDAATGKPLGAVNISIPNYSGALSDDKGSFSIKVPSYNATLIISGEGFQTKEIPLKGKKMVTALLYEESFTSMYDNVVLPFGVKAQSKTVNAISSFNTEGSWNRSTETPDGYLQGKVAGLNATMRSGTPNAGAYLTLRGYNSVYANNQPLIVVDGMIYDINDFGTSLISNHYTNALANIDPRDIENVTVIKDGSSTYGTKGANGVILITTTHAKDVATKIDFGIYSGVNMVPAELPVMKSSDYRTYLSDILKTTGWSQDQIQAQPYMNDTVGNANYYRYHNQTDWQKEVLKQSSTSNVYLKVSGGDDIAKYALSLGYMKNAGVTDNTNMTKYSIRFNSDLNLSRNFTAGTNLAYTYYDQKLMDQGLAAKTNPLYLALIKAPFLHKNDISDLGAISPNFANTDTLGVSNPVAAVNNIIDNSKVYRFTGSIYLKYKLSAYLTLATTGGITVDEVREQRFIPSRGITNDTLSNAIADSRLGSQVKKIFNLYNDTYLDYTRTFNRIHQFSGRIGLRYLNSKSERDVALSYNSATDNFISVGTGSLSTTGGDIGKYTWGNGYIGADYGLSNKYFFSFNMAIDGSSRFGSQISKALGVGGVEYAVMPSLGASWLVSSERFLSKLKFVDILKLRATYSKTGNDDIGNYSAKQSYVSQNLLGMQGLVRGGIANPHLQWESNTKANLGIDVALFNERLSFSFDVYRNKTGNMIMYEPVPAASGYTYALTNSGAMKTNGLELSVGARLINTKSVKWDAGFTLATYKNRITQLPASTNGSVVTSVGGATILTAINLPANSFYGFKTNGVFTSDAEATASGLTRMQSDGVYASFKGGDMRFADVNGDKIINDGDKQVIGNPNPDYTGSFNSKLSWNRLSVEALFTFSQGNKVYNGVRAALESESGSQNQLTSVINRWRAAGQVTNIPRASWGDPMGNSSFSDRWIEDGSFLRMKVISVSYNIPVKGMHSIKSATVYATGNNLLTFTKYLGYDPEFNAAESILAKGVDVGLEPQFKSIIFGVRIGL
jgi:TonB-linked SusC/RagA family outer membrane protein